MIPSPLSMMNVTCSPQKEQRRTVNTSARLLKSQHRTAQIATHTQIATNSNKTGNKNVHNNCTPTVQTQLTVLKLQNLGQPKTNCTASNKLLFPLPFRPTTQFISGEKGWISGCCLKERKFERVTDLMCIF